MEELHPSTLSWKLVALTPGRLPLPQIRVTRLPELGVPLTPVPDPPYLDGSTVLVARAD